MCALLLLAATVAAYLPAFRGGFIWDDDTHLTENACVAGPLGLKDIWTSGEAQYYPLAVTNLWLQYRLWGPHPLPYHAVTVLLHAANAALLGLVLLRLRIPGAWLGALLWAVHPVQAESVAWISETNSTQSALFFLLSLLFFLKWIEPEALTGRTGPLRNYCLAFGCAVLAVLSKSSTVMLPVALGLAWWWTGRWRWRRLPWLAPFLFLSAVFSAWTIWEQKFHSGALGADWNLGGMERLILAGRVVGFYLGKLAWPHPLIFFNPHWILRPERWESYLPISLTLGILALLWRGRRGTLRPALFAYAWFLALLFPVMGFFNVFFFKYSFVADHFQYLADMGPLALAGAGLEWMRRRTPRAGWALAAALPMGLGLLTRSHCAIFHDDESLYRSTLALNSECWLAHNNLGELLAQVPGRLPEAIAEYESTLRLKPDYPEVHNNLAAALFDSPGRLPDAIAEYRVSVRLAPNVAVVRNNLGKALFNSPGGLSEAIEQYQEALRIDPDYAEAHNNLGIALARWPGRRTEAITEYDAALRISPGYAEAHNNLGALLFNSPDHRTEAIRQFRKALQIDPDYVQAHYNLGVALSVLPDRRAEAIAEFEAVLRLDPGCQPARRMLVRLRG